MKHFQDLSERPETTTNPSTPRQIRQTQVKYGRNKSSLPKSNPFASKCACTRVKSHPSTVAPENSRPVSEPSFLTMTGHLRRLLPPSRDLAANGARRGRKAAPLERAARRAASGGRGVDRSGSRSSSATPGRSGDQDLGGDGRTDGRAAPGGILAEKGRWTRSV